MKATKEKRLSRVEASAYLADTWGISRTPKTLDKLASTGGGPAYQKTSVRGRALYTERALDAWAEEKLSPPITSATQLKQMEAA